MIKILTVPGHIRGHMRSTTTWRSVGQPQGVRLAGARACRWWRWSTYCAHIYHSQLGSYQDRSSREIIKLGWSPNFVLVSDSFCFWQKKMVIQAKFGKVLDKIKLMMMVVGWLMQGLMSTTSPGVIHPTNIITNTRNSNIFESCNVLRNWEGIFFVAGGLHLVAG